MNLENKEESEFSPIRIDQAAVAEIQAETILKAINQVKEIESGGPYTPMDKFLKGL